VPGKRLATCATLIGQVESNPAFFGGLRLLELADMLLDEPAAVALDAALPPDARVVVSFTEALAFSAAFSTVLELKHMARGERRIVLERMPCNTLNGDGDLCKSLAAWSDDQLACIEGIKCGSIPKKIENLRGCTDMSVETGVGGRVMLPPNLERLSVGPGPLVYVENIDFGSSPCLASVALREQTVGLPRGLAAVVWSAFEALSRAPSSCRFDIELVHVARAGHLELVDFENEALLVDAVGLLRGRITRMRVNGMPAVLTHLLLDAAAT
jgi:hypothetical protein